MNTTTTYQNKLSLKAAGNCSRLPSLDGRKFVKVDIGVNINEYSSEKKQLAIALITINLFFSKAGYLFETYNTQHYDHYVFVVDKRKLRKINTIIKREFWDNVTKHVEPTSVTDKDFNTKIETAKLNLCIYRQ